MAVNVPIGSPLAAKIYSAAVFAGVQSKQNFLNLMSGAAPQLGAAGAKIKGQSSKDYAVVKITDLTKTFGDKVSVDLFNIFTGKAVMGDKRLAGRGMKTSASSQEVSINRTRQMSDDVGRMNQKRTRHNLREVARNGLTNWASRINDQRALVHLAGARGDQITADWVISQSGDPTFAEEMVNPVFAPTKNRQFFAGAATTHANLGTTDSLTLNDFSKIASQLSESSVPLQSLIMEEDPNGWNSQLYVCWVTARQYAYLKRASQTQINAAMTNAVKRFDGSKKHPLFSGESFLWENILIKKMDRYAIRFAAGTPVTYDTGGADGGTYTEAQSVAAQPIDRAILVGAQALLHAYGNEGDQDYYYNWNEELTDHKGSVEVSISMMDGMAKTRFRINGVDTDHGVCVIDSYAPDLATPAGKALMAA
jgi:N4-gp56 family major capsid protein